MAERKELVPPDQTGFFPQPFPQTENDYYNNDLQNLNKYDPTPPPSLTKIPTQPPSLHTAIRLADPLDDELQSSQLSTQENSKSVLERARYLKRRKFHEKTKNFFDKGGYPGEFYACCDSRSTVLVSNTILAIFSLIYTIFNIITYEIINVMCYAVTFVLTLCIFLNVFCIKSAAFYIMIATTLAITVLGHTVYRAVKLYECVDEEEFNTLKNIPPFETPVICVLLTFGLIQLYRSQSYANALKFVRYHPNN